ncbi:MULTISPECIES: lactonase family protein [Paenibacillus]|uniref:Beta-propeller fold lactonase family protein n=1 Tax=Paenibacillus validus TaxID=44253 RepID=A0A7X3CRW5_9BACL|nr:MULTISPECIES: lactonase family protein [Paenibacillus]MUG70672.1 beta-propeller fold lactonase family protein [Paenibacillus validus]
MEKKKKVLAFIGSYADSANPGLYACRFDTDTGSLEIVDQASGLQNPTFLDVDQDRLKLYAITEGTDAKGQRCGAAAAYDIDPSTGTLSLLNKELTVPSPTCHITLDHTRQCIMVSSYHGGMIGLSPVMEDGRVGPTADIHQHKGASILPVQDRPRAHSVFVDRSNRFAVASDLGLDRLMIYKLDVPARRLIPHGEVRIAPGSGPRHFAFHPQLPYGYVINELNATITGFSYDQEQGALHEIQTVSTLPDAYEGDNACADIHISPDGKFLYGSNRGHDSIAVYAIDPFTGKLALVEHASTLGGHPRNFALSPDGRFLLAANRDSNNIVTFNRDAETGKLLPAGPVLEVSKPVCIKFAAWD